MEEKKVVIGNINCGHCLASIQRELSQLGGVSAVEGDAKTRRVTVRWQAPATWKTIVEKLTQLGYPPQE